MTCSEAQELIEPIASGDVAAPPSFSSHLAGCVECSAALTAAVRIERALAMQPTAPAPVNFSQAVAVAVRRQRWQHEEHVDRAFNVTIAIAILIIVAAIVSLLNVSGVAQMLLVAVDTVSDAAQQAPPWRGSGSLPAAGLTAAIVATALGLWWWSERRSDFQDG